MEQVDAGRLVAKVLAESGVTTAFVLQGGHVDPVLYGCEAEGIRLVDTRHEQAAAHMAEGWALATGETGVCVVTAGPGFSDAVTGLANAFMSASPMLCLAGARPLREADTWPLQDLDQVGIARPITKWARSVSTATRAGEYAAIALTEARTGRPGPVYLDVPVDIVTQQVPVPDALPRAVVPFAPGPEAGALAEVVRMIEQAERPIVMIGSGAYWSGSADALGRLAETVGLPVFSSNAGRGLLPDAHDWSFGAPVPLGSAFMSAISADLVICLGVRLGYPLLNGAYFGAAKVVRVDIDGAETARNRPGDLNVCADVRVFCEAVSDAWEGGVSQGRAAWGESLRAAKSQSRADLHAMIANHDGKLPHPLELALAIGDVVGPDATIVADGGDILTWGIIGLPALGPGRLLTTGVYLGCLGVGIPFAIAAKVARPDEPVVLLSGDGTFGLNAMEYDTAIRHDIPFVTVVSADGSWGMSRHGQEMHHDGHTVATQLGVRPYHEVVRALGGHGEFVDAPEEIRPAIQRALDSGLPACVNVGIDPTLCSPLTQAMASLGTA